MSDSDVPTAPPVPAADTPALDPPPALAAPAVPSLEAPPDPSLGDIDPGAMASKPEPAAPTPEEQREEVKSNLLKQLQEKHPEVTDAWIEDAKQKFGRVYIFPIFDDVFLIRPLRRGEWKELNSGDAEGKPLTQDAMEEAICLKATLFPAMQPGEVSRGGLAGIPTAVTNYVEVISGFRPEIGPILL